MSFLSKDEIVRKNMKKDNSISFLSELISKATLTVSYDSFHIADCKSLGAWTELEQGAGGGCRIF